MTVAAFVFGNCGDNKSNKRSRQTKCFPLRRKMATEKVIDFVAQDQIYKDYVRKERDSVGQWVRAFDFMLSEESLVRTFDEIR